MQHVLVTLHLSIRSVFVITVLLAQIAGLCLLTYILNALRMTSALRWCAFVLLGLQSAQLNLSLNYQLVRFLIPIACLVFVSRRRGDLTLGFALLLSQALSLAISPEMGFAFFAGGMAYPLLRFAMERHKAFLWMACLPGVSTAMFFAGSLWLGGGYLRTLLLFSRGLLGFVVQPIPYILVFLFALVGLVPWLLAQKLQKKAVEAPLLGALYASGLGLLPVALSRADPTHVLMNGVVIYLLSFVAISKAGLWQQRTWMGVTAAIFSFTFVFNSREYTNQLLGTIPGLRGQPRLQQAAYLLVLTLRPSTTRDAFSAEPSATVDVAAIRQIVGKAKVIQPLVTSRQVDLQLSNAGLYMPSFYYGFMNVLDRESERKQLADIGQAQWALMPEEFNLRIFETPDRKGPLGPQFLYRMRRPPYVVGQLLVEDFRTNWVAVEHIPRGYVLYRKR